MFEKLLTVIRCEHGISGSTELRVSDLLQERADQTVERSDVCGVASADRHAQWVFSIPKMLRHATALYRGRELLGDRRETRLRDRPLETSHAERFINEHLPRCRCGDPYRRRHVGTSKSIRYLMEYLSERGLVVVTSPPSAAVPKNFFRKYLDYLKGNRYLAAFKQHARYLTPPRGASRRFRRVPVPAARRAQVLTLTKHAQDRGGAATMPARSFAFVPSLRFRKGTCSCGTWRGSPKIRSYKLSDAPRGISEEDARKTLQCIAARRLAVCVLRSSCCTATGFAEARSALRRR